MRVLHVHSGNIFGGIETMLVTIAREQQRQGGERLHVALCFGGRVAEALAAAGAVVFQLGNVRLSRPMTVRRARRSLEARLAALHPDLVVTHAPWSQLVFGRVVKRLGYPLVTWMHGPAGSLMARAAAVHRPDAILCNSAFTASSIPHSYRSIPHEVIYCPAILSGAGAARASIRAQLGAGEEDVVIIEASRLEKLKGHDVHLDALGELRQLQNWVLWIAGSAQRPVDIPFEATLHERAERLGIADRVTFLGERDDVRTLLAGADIYCQPNTGPESFGLSYVEALAAGIPVVASDLGGAREIVTPEVGILVRPSDVGDLANALRRLITNPAERLRLGRAGPGRAAALCDPVRQVAAVNAFLQKFIPATA